MTAKQVLGWSVAIVLLVIVALSASSIYARMHPSTNPEDYTFAQCESVTLQEVGTTRYLAGLQEEPQVYYGLWESASRWISGQWQSIFALDYPKVGATVNIPAVVGGEVFEGVYANAFEDSDLYMLTLSDTYVYDIQQSAFKNSQMCYIALPDSVATIGANAFLGCSSLLRLDVFAVVPPTIHDINGLDNLKTLYVPHESVDAYKSAPIWSDLADKIRGTDAHIRHNAKGDIITSASDYVYSLDDDNKATILAIRKSANNTDVCVIPVTVDGYIVDKLGDYSLNGFGFREVIFAEGSQLTEIGQYVFESESMTTINLPDSLRVIHSCAFWGCYNLSSVTIPAGVTQINNYAFATTSLTRITFLGETPPVTDVANGYQIFAQAWIIVPDGCRLAYANSSEAMTHYAGRIIESSNVDKLSSALKVINIPVVLDNEVIDYYTYMDNTSLMLYLWINTHSTQENQYQSSVKIGSSFADSVQFAYCKSVTITLLGPNKCDVTANTDLHNGIDYDNTFSLVFAVSDFTGVNKKDKYECKIFGGGE